jgi:PiT family inorganic phosphate transporter
MEALFDGSLGTGTLLLLVFSLLIAFGFEFVNGFHDTANAVATVIYTRSLRPWTAVILSGICNFLGVFIGGIAVAMSIINLLPVELLVAGGSGEGLAMLLALLLAAIVWNLGTWYFGLPSSSSHTLIGAIVGVGLANSMLPGPRVRGRRQLGEGRRRRAGAADLAGRRVHPGGAAAAGGKKLINDPQLYRPPVGTQPPPLWIRSVLIGDLHGGELRARVERRAEGRRPGDADPDGDRAGGLRPQPRGGGAGAGEGRRWRSTRWRWTSRSMRQAAGPGAARGARTSSATVLAASAT